MNGRGYGVNNKGRYRAAWAAQNHTREFENQWSRSYILDIYHHFIQFYWHLYTADGSIIYNMSIDIKPLSMCRYSGSDKTTGVDQACYVFILFD